MPHTPCQSALPTVVGKQKAVENRRRSTVRAPTIGAHTD